MFAIGTTHYISVWPVVDYAGNPITTATWDVKLLDSQSSVVATGSMEYAGDTRYIGYITVPNDAESGATYTLQLVGTATVDGVDYSWRLEREDQAGVQTF